MTVPAGSVANLLRAVEIANQQAKEVVADRAELLLELKICLSCLEDVDKIAPYEDDLRKSVAKAISGARELIARIESE